LNAIPYHPSRPLQPAGEIVARQGCCRVSMGASEARAWGGANED
jgi:hypothetical protein